MAREILNYAWINARRQNPGDAVNPIPGKWCANVVKTARQYPQASIIVWIDEGFMSDASIDLVRRRFADERNMEVRNLRDIPAYKQDALFEMSQDETARDIIWAQVDYARLLVLQHVLQEMNASAAFYSDFDIVDIQLETVRLRDVFERYGIVIGQAPPATLENQFFGFARTQLPFLSRYLVPQTRQSIAQGEPSGFDAYVDCMELAAKTEGVEPLALTVPTEELGMMP